MKAGYYVGDETYEVREIPEPSPVDNQVKIRVAWCGLCGTDRHKFLGMGGASPVVPPIILGHECSGTVVEVGPDCTRFQVGDRVACNPSWSCGVCEWCTSGRPHFCVHRHGVAKGLSEYICPPEQNVFKVSEGLDLEDAAWTEPLSCVVHGLDLIDIHSGAHVVIYGLGSIGSMMLQLVMQTAPATVTVVEREESKRALALSLGATEAVSDTDIGDLAESTNFDYVIECIGLRATMEDALRIAGKGAKVLFFGLGDPDSPVRLDQYTAYTKELSIYTSYLNPNTTGRAARLLENGRLRTRELVSIELSLGEVGEELRSPIHMAEGKVMVRLSGEH